MEEVRMPLIGDDAPAFHAVTTQGEINFPEDYKGKWVILFSHPADFTPVCTTEFMTFGSMMDEFKALNTELIGLSVDSLYSHIAWLRKIQELEWNGKKHIEVKFPQHKPFEQCLSLTHKQRSEQFSIIHFQQEETLMK